MAPRPGDLLLEEFGELAAIVETSQIVRVRPRYLLPELAAPAQGKQGKGDGQHQRGKDQIHRREGAIAERPFDEELVNAELVAQEPHDKSQRTDECELDQTPHVLGLPGT